MSNTAVFKQFYSRLVQTLPMNDAVFIAELFSNNLLPDDLKSQLNSQETPADKATHFLDRVIKPSLTISSTNFNEFLNVMEDSEYQHIKELAKQIRVSLRKSSHTDNASWSSGQSNNWVNFGLAYN